MHDYNTIVGVISLRNDKFSYPVIRQRYGIGNSGIDLIMNRYKESGLPWKDFLKLEPSQIEELIYPPKNIRKNDIPMPDFELYYERMMTKGSRVNMFYCWLDYKSEHPNGYQSSQFYEYFNRFIEKNYGGDKVAMAVERIPGEKLYIDWVGDQPELLVDPHTGEIRKIHVFTTTLGVSSLVYAECFLDEKLPSFIQGTINAITFYDAVPRYLVPDNCKTAVTKHTKDELVLNTAYQDLEEFYNVIILPPPARKPKGKPSVESHVRYLETHLIERLKEGIYTSLESLNDATQKIIADINRREFQKKIGYVMNADGTINVKSSIKKALKNNTYNYMVGMDLHQVPKKDKEKFDQYLIVGHVPCFRLNKDMSSKFYRTDYYMDIDAGAGHMEQGGTLGCYCVTTDDEIYL